MPERRMSRRRVLYNQRMMRYLRRLLKKSTRIVLYGGATVLAALPFTARDMSNTSFGLGTAYADVPGGGDGGGDSDDGPGGGNDWSSISGIGEASDYSGDESGGDDE